MTSPSVARRHRRPENLDQQFSSLLLNVGAALLQRTGQCPDEEPGPGQRHVGTDVAEVEKPGVQPVPGHGGEARGRYSPLPTNTSHALRGLPSMRATSGSDSQSTRISAMAAAGHLLQRCSRCSRSCTRLGYPPRLAVLRNHRGGASSTRTPPGSTAIALSARTASTPSDTSVTPMSRAKWFSAPAGTTTNGNPLLAATVPSPPATPSARTGDRAEAVHAGVHPGIGHRRRDGGHGQSMGSFPSLPR
jgi:hypothetical protein